MVSDLHLLYIDSYFPQECAEQTLHACTGYCFSHPLATVFYKFHLLKLPDSLLSDCIENYFGVGFFSDSTMI